MSRTFGLFRIEKNKQDLVGVLDGRAIIGKNVKSNVVLDDSRVGAFHALIEKNDDGTFTVIDLGSFYGIYKNGRRIEQSRIKTKERLVIGSHSYCLDFVDADQKRASLTVVPPEKDDSEKLNRKVRSAPELVTNLNVLEVTLVWGERTLEVRTFREGAVITIGPQKDATFTIALRGEKLQRTPVRLAQYEKGFVAFHLPVEASGLIWQGAETISIDNLRHQDKSKTEFSDLNLKIRVGDRAHIEFGELSLNFRFVAKVRQEIRPFWKDLDATFVKIGVATVAFFLLVAGLLSIREKPPAPPTLAQIPAQLKRVLYNAGIENALRKQQAAIGQLAQNLEGGRAKGTEGKVSGQFDRRKVVQHKAALRHRMNAVAQSESAAIQKELNTAFSAGSTIETNPTAKAVVMEGSPHAGNAAAAIINGGFARGTQGLGPGGGGQSVGIGSLEGYSTGGGLGAGDFGLSPSKGRAIHIGDLQQTDIEVLGGLDPSVIAAIIRRYLAQIQNCYEQQLTLHPNLRGKVTVAFIIGPNGGVEKANIFESTLNNLPTEECIVHHVEGWKFPRPRGGGTVGVKYPFLLMSNGN